MILKIRVPFVNIDFSSPLCYEWPLVTIPHQAVILQLHVGAEFQFV